jgi:hypothetical protein
MLGCQHPVGLGGIHSFKRFLFAKQIIASTSPSTSPRVFASMQPGSEVLQIGGELEPLVQRGTLGNSS